MACVQRWAVVALLTPTATADTADLVDATYPFIIEGVAATQLTKIWEISINGQAPSSSSPCIMLLSRDSQLATGSNTYTAGITMDNHMDPATAALAAPVALAHAGDYADIMLGSFYSPASFREHCAIV